MLHANRDRCTGPGKLSAAESRPEAVGGRHGLAQGIRARLTKGELTVEARATRTELRNFGLIVGGIFGALAIWPAIFRGGTVGPWLVAVAAVLILPASVVPRASGPALAEWSR